MKTQSPVSPHYWDIEPAHGPVSHGRCKLCGLEKDFNNFVTDDKHPLVTRIKHENYKTSDWQVYRGLNPNKGLRI